MKSKKEIVNPVLQTWQTLQAGVRDASEAQCEELLKEEKKGRNRPQFVLRIFSRLNRMRALRERQGLVDK